MEKMTFELFFEDEETPFRHAWYECILTHLKLGLEFHVCQKGTIITHLETQQVYNLLLWSHLV